MLKVNDLSCRRGGRRIFQHVSFTLERGAALLITGTNGSGKSSLLRLLAGLLPVTEGSIHWKGQRITAHNHEYRRDLCYIGHLDGLKPQLTGTETLDYWHTLLQQPKLQKECLSDDPFGVQSFINKPVRYLSAGQRRRLALSRLLLSSTDLWLLDEPTAALDPDGQSTLIKILERHRQKGGLVLMTTHHDIQIAQTSFLQMKGE